MRKKISTLFIILTTFSFNGVNAQDVNIDFSNEQQIIRGFGGINFPAWIGDLNEDMREKAFSNNPGEIGLSILRMQVPPDSTQFNREIPTAEYAKSQGATLFASPWNPPSNLRELLKETNNGTDYVIPSENYPAYVDHLNSFVSYMETNNVPLYAISVQNEPDWHGWTTWTANQMLSFVKNYAQNINCKVIAPESLGYVRSTIDPLLNDSIANSHIDILGTHLYGTPINNYYYPLAYEKGKEIWMTEHLWGSEKPEDNTWELALDIAEEINTCMDAQMSAFVYWYIRRFYGLINDDGNITDKGYVMSQFSKFIRPGFHRIDTDFKPVSGVTTTAYKSDSSLVVVVVNTNSNSVDLNLVLTNNNLPFESLTKFTSSENKKMNNDGTQELSGENIAITVDGKSISTFTSNPTGGGKYGNELPIAYLGENINIEIFDSLGTGQVEYSLKGSESTDTDGEIVKYSWAKNGEQFSTQADLDLVLEIGSHTYVLTITDNDGATATSTIVIDVINNNSEEVWMEAECTLVGDNWDIIEDDETSNQKYLTVKAGIEAVDQASTDPNALLTYQFSITEAGNFKVWARVLAPSYSDDSFWIKLDDGEWVMWNGLAENSGWAWNDVNDADGVPLIYPLEVGEHSLLFCFREDGAAIDKFYLTNTGQVPSAFGDDASNCIDNIDNGINSKLINQTITVFPNPVKSNFCIESNEPIELLIITDINGRQILKKAYTTVIYSDEIEIKVDDGIYMLQIVNDSHTVVTKVLVEN